MLNALIDGYAWTATYPIAVVHAYRNEIDPAFEWLERAYAQRDPGVPFSASDGILRPLHGDPRWRPFLHELGLG